MGIKSIVIGLAGVVALFGNAHAAITLVVDPVGVQEADEGQCIFGGPMGCYNNNLPTGGSPGSDTADEIADTDLMSNALTVGAIRDLVDDLFSVGIDVNPNGQMDTEGLIRFAIETSTDGAMWSVLDEFTADPRADLSNTNTGNGFSDYLLEGFDLTGLADGLFVRFAVQMDMLGAGVETFFLVDVAENMDVVPLPAAGWLMIAGILGFAGAGRAKKS